MNTITVYLTEAERGHLVSLLYDANIEGSYYGNREQYRARERRLIIKLESAQRGCKRKLVPKEEWRP